MKAPKALFLICIRHLSNEIVFILHTKFFSGSVNSYVVRFFRIIFKIGLKILAVSEITVDLGDKIRPFIP